ncbi:lamin tail domain-containing protein [Fluviicola sp.]|uniref:lamin tail domain-containing protein n=1 Tax=Fluviicola sp. TaxID=1917219 RepID=UPI0031E13D8F
MKKTLLFLGMLSSVAYAQDCSKIFISEYVEGWSNNKALEIYNPTSSPVDLSQYFVARYSNGSSSATNANAVQLSGTIAPHDVFVAVLDKRDPNGTGQEAPIWDSLQVRGDGFFSPVYNTSNAFYWNGNDAVLLAKGTLTSTPTASITTATGFAIIDVFGKIGENPANATGSTANNDGAWSTTFPYSTGQGVLVTMDHSMIRKASVKKGVTANPSFFNPLGEWDTIPAVTYVYDQNGNPISGANGPILFGNWFSLGKHDCDCNPLSVGENKMDEVAVYPNPTTDGIVYVKNTQEVKEITVLNALGQNVNRFANNASPVMSVRLGNDKGVYLIRITQNNGTVLTKRVVLK